MPYSTKQMLRDANGDLIPQYWDITEQEFKPLTGQDGANDVRLTGSNVVLAKTEVSSGITGFRVGRIGITGVTAFPQAVDIRNYRNLFIYIHNKTNVELTNLGVVFVEKENRATETPSNPPLYRLSTDKSVASGARQVLMPSEFPELKNPSLYCALEYTNNNFATTEGSIEVIFIGGN